MCALLALLWISAPARASLYDTYGFGARGTTMGSALTALGRHYEAVYYNPANLLLRKETHLGIAFDLVAPQITMERTSGEEPFEPIVPAANVGALIGVSTPIGGVFANRFAVGFTLFHPLVRFTRIESIDPTFPYLYRYQNLPDKLILAGALAWEPVDWLRVGAGVQILADLAGTVTTAMSIKEGRFTHETIDLELRSVVAPTVGVSVGPVRGWRLGLTYRSPLELSYHIPIELLIEEVGRLEVLIDGVSLYTPGQLAAGVAWESGEPIGVGWSVEAGLTWSRWAAAPPAGAVFELTIDDSASSDDPQNLIDAYADAIDLAARDTVTPRLGVEWRPSDVWTLRAGYFWRPTPLPNPIHQTNTLDATSHGIGLGGGFTFRDPTRVSRTPLHVDLGLQLTVLESRDVEKASTGQPDGSFRFGGVIWNTVLGVRHDF